MFCECISYIEKLICDAENYGKLNSYGCFKIDLDKLPKNITIPKTITRPPIVLVEDNENVDVLCMSTSKFIKMLTVFLDTIKANPEKCIWA